MVGNSARRVFSSFSPSKKATVAYNGILVPVRTSVGWRRRNEYSNELYQLKVDVGMLNTVKIDLADNLNVSPLSQQK